LVAGLLIFEVLVATVGWMVVMIMGMAEVEGDSEVKTTTTTINSGE